MSDLGNDIENNAVSIIIPVYNRSGTIGRCLTSAMHQTLQDIEIVCVDDGSEDDTADIIRRQASTDSRIKLISLPDNKGCLCARKRGVAAANGKYIMFLDSDDTLEPDACETLLALAEQSGADITQGNVQIHYEKDDLTPETKNELVRLLTPFYGVLKGPDVFRGYFIRHQIGQSLLCHLFRSDICKMGFQRLSDEYMILAEDFMATASMTLLSSSYSGINTKPLYHYNYGGGVSTSWDSLSAEQFAKRAGSLLLCNQMIHALLNEHGLAQELSVQEALRLFQDSNVRAVFHWWSFSVSSADKERAFSAIASDLEPPDIIRYFRRLYEDRHAVLAKALHGNELLHVRAAQVTTIGIHYARYTIGGVERVLSQLFPMWLSMGYQVVFFCDLKPEPEEYDIPEGVVRLLLPNDAADEKSERSAFLSKAILSYHIDAYIDCDWLNPSLLWDMLTVKLTGVPFIIYSHGSILYQLQNNSKFVSDSLEVFPLSDLVLALDRVSCAFWEQLCIPTICIMNPCSPATTAFTKPLGQTAVWVGRISGEKQPFMAVEIMRRVTKALPDARLLIVGSGTPQLVEKLKRTICAKGLKQNVILCGYQADVDTFFDQASVYLHTSMTESWAMSIYEALRSGRPVVMFDLPYLTLVQGNEGITSVPMNNCDAAADEIIRLFSDADYLSEKSLAALAAAERFAGHDLRQDWRSIFDAVSTNQDPKFFIPTDEERRVMLCQLIACQVHTPSGFQPAVEAPYTVRKTRLRCIVTFIPRAIHWTIYSYKRFGGFRGVAGLYKRKFKKYFLGIPDPMEEYYD